MSLTVLITAHTCILEYIVFADTDLHSIIKCFQMYLIDITAKQ